MGLKFFFFRKYAPEGIGSYSYSFKEGNPGNHTGQDYDKVIRCSCLIYNPYRRVDVWRFFTYMFLHGGWMHLGWNVVIQLLVGESKSNPILSNPIQSNPFQSNPI